MFLEVGAEIAYGSVGVMKTFCDLLQGELFDVDGAKDFVALVGFCFWV